MIATPTDKQMTPSATGIARAALLQKLGGYVNTQLVYIVAQLGLADLLVNGPQSSATLSAELGIALDTLHRLLRGCVANGLLNEVDGGRFAATPLIQLLESARPDSLRDYAILTGELWYPAWGRLFAALQTGETPFEQVFGMDYYSYLAQNPALGIRFQTFMQIRIVQNARSLTHIYDFSTAKLVVDIGGGNGTLLQQLLEANPHLQGILYDLPEVIKANQKRVELQLLGSRCQLISGDYLQQVPAGGDHYVLSRVLHNWSDDQCLQILRNCLAAMPPASRLLILEQVIPERLQGPLPSIESDLMMLVFLRAQERTLADYERLLVAAGFDRIAIHPLERLGYSVIEARPHIQ